METGSQKRREEAIRRLRKFRGSLPADFKFDREEANFREPLPIDEADDKSGGTSRERTKE
jgi:hypothetical protein